MAFKVAGLKAEMPELQSFSLPPYDQLISGDARPFLYEKLWDESMDDPVIVLQTSGSTGQDFTNELFRRH